MHNHIFLNDSELLFCSWLSPLIDKSHKQGTLHLDDLYGVPDYLESAKLIDRLEGNWLDEKRRYPQNPSLLRATLRTMDWNFMLNGLLLIPIVSTHNRSFVQ